MSLRSVHFLRDAPHETSPAYKDSRWQAIAAGLQLVAAGYCALILGSAAALVLVWLAVVGRAAPAGGGGHGDNSLSLLVGLTVLLTAALSYGLVLAGQWRCLMYAPHRHGAKEFMYVSFHCLIVGAVLNAFGACLDGGRTAAALQGGWPGLDAWNACSLMQFASLAVGLTGSLVFSRFLRLVAESFNDRRAVRAVDLNLWVMATLIGGTAAVYVWLRGLGFQGETLPWLAGGWLACCAWHLGLVVKMRGRLAEGMRRVAEASVVPPPPAGVGLMHMRSLSGLRRLARNAGA